jgi:hypothetical protein
MQCSIVILDTAEQVGLICRDVGESARSKFVIFQCWERVSAQAQHERSKFGLIQGRERVGAEAQHARGANLVLFKAGSERSEREANKRSLLAALNSVAAPHASLAAF